MVVCVHVDLPGVPAVAAAACLAIDYHLRRKVHVRPGSLSHDVYAIGHRTRRSVSPATPAVYWDVLIAAPGEVVGATDVTPIPALWQVAHAQVLMRTRRGYMLGN